MPSELPVEVLRLIFEEAVRDTLCGLSDWPAHVRLVCRAVRDWTQPLLFEHLLVTNSTLAPFIELAALESPPFVDCVRSLNLLINGPEEEERLVVEANVVVRCPNVQRLCCPFGLLYYAAIAPETTMAPTHLSIWQDVTALPIPPATSVRVFQNVTYFRFVAYSFIRGSFVEELPALQDVVMDVIHVFEGIFDVNVDTLRKLPTVRRIKVLCHLSSAGEKVARALVAKCGDSRITVTVASSGTVCYDFQHVLSVWTAGILSGGNHWE